MLLLDINWQSLWFGDESFSFLLEVLIRTTAMFLVILVSLRLLGKRSVAQLSVFELGVIIGLGSAAGDPMFYSEVGLLPSILTFVIIIGLYRLITYFINHNESAEALLEGKPVYILEEGKLNYDHFEKESIAHEELFMQLRMKNVTHLGQVQYAILETNGSVSVLLYPNEQPQWGLPILPHLCEKTMIRPSEKGLYACHYCGHTKNIETTGKELRCPTCGRKGWVRAINDLRIS